ncbi:MAG: hypothetical protein GC200_10980 [Tepidisphaera sp.]|nr:hypothetical protein [Tepidisphaera sp.]
MPANPPQPGPPDDALLWFWAAVRDGDINTIERLLAAGVPRATLEITPLSWAISDGNLSMLKYLLALGFSMTEEVALAEPWDFPLHEAAQKGDLEILKVLLKQPDAKHFLNRFDDNWLGYTPLHMAVMANHPDAVRLLIAAGADVDANDEPHIGDTAIRRAVEENHESIVLMLLKAGANPDIPGWMWISARDKAADSTPEIRRLIDAVPFRPVEHPRYIRDGQWPPRRS